LLKVISSALNVASQSNNNISGALVKNIFRAVLGTCNVQLYWG